jgi:hypothetical protein
MLGSKRSSAIASRALAPDKKKELDAIVLRHARKYCMDELPAGV